MSLENEQARWEEEVLAPLLARFPERKPTFQTNSGITIPRFLTGEDWDGEYMQKLGFPGEYPYTRGVQPTMYRGRLWTMRQYAGYASAEESNRRYRFLLEQGQTGLSVAFDLPTQIGYDADHPLAIGEVGRVGVSVSSIEDMQTLFNTIPLDEVSTSMTINAPAAILLAMYIAVAQSQGVEMRALRGTVQNDILKEYIARGTYIFPPQPSMRLITDIFRFCQKEIPNWNTISISGYHIREAGSTAVQEVAFTLANGIAYVQAAVDADLDVNNFAAKLSFFFNAHNNFLEEVAKFRAARRMWARIMRTRFQSCNPQSWALRFHAQTAGSTLTAQQAENNIVRVALQAMAAVLGGTQSLHTNSMDEALCLPSEGSAQVALRTQQIIAYESGISDTIDPLAGSFFVEYLTDEIERRANEYLERIDEMGGALRAIESGFIQDEIQRVAYHYQQRFESGDQIQVGANAFRSDGSLGLEPLQVEAGIEYAQCTRLEHLRARRDANRVNELLAYLEHATRGDENLMPVLIECVQAGITLGEICGLLRQLWGEYEPPVWV